MKQQMAAAALAVIFCAPLPVSAESNNASLSAKIAREARQLGESGLVEWRRAEIAEDMSLSARLLWEKRRTSEIDRKTIESITALLDDHSDAVRGESAATLGFIGRGARSAVPALKRALNRIQAEKAALEILTAGDSESAIRLALRRIAGIPDDLDQ